MISLFSGTYFALQQAMTLGAKDAESQTFLFALMDRLEAVSGSFLTSPLVPISRSS